MQFHSQVGKERERREASLFLKPGNEPIVVHLGGNSTTTAEFLTLLSESGWAVASR